MAYTVVFENQIDGGSKGIRTIVRFTDKTAVNTLDGHKILAEGISDSEAIHIASLTPEICYVVYAAAKSLDKQTTIHPEAFDYRMQMAIFEIQYCREFLSGQDTSNRPDISAYLAELKANCTSSSIKDNFLQKVLSICTPQGTLDLNKLRILMRSTVYDIVALRYLNLD